MVNVKRTLYILQTFSPVEFPSTQLCEDVRIVWAML